MTPTTQQIIHGIASLNAALTHALTGEWEACARNLAAAAEHVGVELYAIRGPEELIHSVRTPIICAMTALNNAAIDLECCDDPGRPFRLANLPISTAFTRAWLMTEPEIASGRATAKAA